MLKVNAVKCLKCNCVIYSRARHDFRWCKCKNIAVDGGLDYFKISITPKNDQYDILDDFEVNCTKNELYMDWNHSIDDYGLVEEE